MDGADTKAAVANHSVQHRSKKGNNN
jgi:hypothetical protein